MAAIKDYSCYRVDDIRFKLQYAGFYPLDIMVAGVTGAGKSTTLNSFFQKELAKVGDGVDPETMIVDSYRLSNQIRLWDTPGLGDSPAADRRHISKIVELLKKSWSNGRYGIIDLALIILEGGSRDKMMTDILLNEVVIPNIPSNRILVAINQADFAMKGHHWNHETNTPDYKLLDFLNEKAASIQMRVKRDTGAVIPHPVFYSAKYGYNVDKLFDLIIDHIPRNRRSMK